MNKKLVISLVMMGLSVSACSTSRALNTGLNPSRPTPLPAAPSGQVQSTDLSSGVATDPNLRDQLENQQVANTQVQTAPTAPKTPENIQTASLEQAKPPSKPITKDSMAGVWNVPTDGSGCKVMLAFTQWSGGYKAATKSCSSQEVASVYVWNVSGQQVVLSDSKGNTVARLYSAGGSRYDGTTSSGKPISLSR